MAFQNLMNIFAFNFESQTFSHGHNFINESYVIRLEHHKISLCYRIWPKFFPCGIQSFVCHLSQCINNYGEAIQKSEVVFPKLPKFKLRVIGYIKTLSEECSRIELFEVRDELLVHGLERRCRIRA